MSQSGGSGPDFHLPDEVLAVIPIDPYDQLDLARKITSMAIASRVSNLESEVERLKQKMSEKDHQILEFEDKASHLEQAYHEANLRLKMARDDNMKLSKERDSFAITARKLGRDLAKCQRTLPSLSKPGKLPPKRDETSWVYYLASSTPVRCLTLRSAFGLVVDVTAQLDGLFRQAETVDIVTYDQSVPKSYPVTDEDTNGHSAHRSFSSTESGYLTDNASKQAGQRFSMTPYITPRLTPTGTPKIVSTTGSPIRYSAAASPQETSRTTSPTKTQYERRSALPSWYPSSQQSSATNSPPRGRPVPGLG
ncbi:hypothetical protein Acr_17g0013490 [Actinidia rufa]|uniref:Uncharacterized protein n=1 Tax=Actinidia rufa TaxID=165716 RepID=A0A7J0G4T4_9ERIC|nr:hypothetical protein Acr_17g0013490 [Actinidia rufa]